jgi:exopolyphosphatase / guanosine-5'-triphosphate,3'-diphosphate pyrophosphatase
MTPRRRAVIDIGTNSVKLLIGEVAGEQVVPLHEEADQTRLGRGFYATHRLQPEAIARTAHAVADFAARARQAGVTQPRVIATSAARDAANGEELVSAVRAACDLPVEIISGEQEAEWAFLGVASDPALSHQALLIVDAGGGSTEFILGEGRHAHFRRSFRLGTVRLLEQLHPADPPTPEDWARCRETLHRVFEREIVPAIEPARRALKHRTLQLVGTSGTVSILASLAQGLTGFQRDRIEAARLTRAYIRGERERLWSLPLDQRKVLPGLPPERADVILTGVAIYEAVMDEFHGPDLRVSTRGLRFAALMTAGD